MKNAAHKKIFISYRVEDMAGYAGRLTDMLKQHFADDQVFRDVDNLVYGTDFDTAIEKTLDDCDVFLALIGPDWLGDKGGSLRIMQDNDWVRLEVAKALKRNISVVPVLVNGTPLPRPDQLPADLQDLLRKQTFDLRDRHWRSDTDELLNFLVNTAGIKPLKAPLATTVAVSKNRKRMMLFMSGGFVLAVALIVFLSLYFTKDDGAAATGTADQSTPAQDSSATAADSTTDNTHVLSASSQQVNSDEALIGAWENPAYKNDVYTLKQEGTQHSLSYESNGQFVSTGTWEMAEDNSIEIHYTDDDVAVVIKAKLSNDGNTLDGTYKAGGDPEEKIQLVRKPG